MEGKRIDSQLGYAYLLISSYDSSSYTVYSALNESFSGELSQKEINADLNGLITRILDENVGDLDGVDITTIKAIYLGGIGLGVTHLPVLYLILDKYQWLEEIDLCNSSFGKINRSKCGKKFLQAVACHPSLKSFGAEECELSFDLTCTFNCIAKHPSLEVLELDFSATAFGQKEVDALCNLLMHNNTLKTIGLGTIHSGEKGLDNLENLKCDLLLECLAFNKTITELRLPYGLNIDRMEVAKILDQNNGDRQSLLHSVTSPLIDRGLYDLESFSPNLEESPTKKHRIC